MDQPPEDLEETFLLANDLGWTTETLARLREGVELVRPVPDDAVRVLPAREGETTSRIQVALGEGLAVFLDRAADELADAFVQPLKDALADHAERPGVEAHRVALSGLHRDVEVLVVCDDADADEVQRAVDRWGDVRELVDNVLDNRGPGNVRYLDVAWAPPVRAWVVRETMLVTGEVLPGPVFEREAA